MLIDTKLNFSDLFIAVSIPLSSLLKCLYSMSSFVINWLSTGWVLSLINSLNSLGRNLRVGSDLNLRENQRGNYFTY